MSAFIQMAYSLTEAGLVEAWLTTCDNCTCTAGTFNLAARTIQEDGLKELTENGTRIKELPCGGRCVLGLRPVPWLTTQTSVPNSPASPTRIIFEARSN